MTASSGAFAAISTAAKDKEVTMEQRQYKTVGKSIRKKDSMQLLLGKAVYTDDITPKDALVVKLLRSPHANAMVRSPPLPCSPEW